MTVAIIILALIALCILGVARAIRNYNADKIIEARNEARRIRLEKIKLRKKKT